MNSGFSDPNNHVPEITPEDEWGDSDGHLAETGQSTAVLPPRRPASDKTPSMVANPETGLRIDSKVVRDDPSDAPRQLEVQEINGSVVRLEQDDSAPPRVDRVVTFREKPAHLGGGKNPRGEGKEWGRVHGGSPRWILGMGAGVAILLVLGVALLPKINATNAARKTPGSEMPLPDEDEKPKGIDQMNRLLERQSEAMRIYRSFTQAAHFDEIVPMIRDGAALKEALRERWQPTMISSKWAPAEDSIWNVMELEGHPCGVLQGRLPDHSEFTTYFTYDHDRLLLDWKATTAYGTASFAELESGQCDGSEIRGEISLADFYTSAFPESVYQSMRLVSPDGKIAIWCYATRNTEAHAKIAGQLQTSEIIQEAQGPKKITLRLEHATDGALPNQWLVGELLHMDWVSP